MLCLSFLKTFPKVFFGHLFIFGCAGCSMLQGLLSSCDKWGLLFICGVWAFYCGGFSCCEARALGLLGATAQVRLLWWTSLNHVALQHVGSSQIGDHTRVSCTGREILYHRATRFSGALCTLHKGFLISSNPLSWFLFHLLWTSPWTTFYNNYLKLFVLWGLLSRKTKKKYSLHTHTYFWDLHWATVPLFARAKCFLTS